MDEESCPNISEYYNTHVIARRVAFGEHREVIGGLWDDIGQLQFEYLVSAGLLPEHRLIDIGCGCLRGGVHFVRYLAPGNYVGVDRNNSLLDAGYNIELAEVGLQDRLPRENLICVENFDFARTGGNFDFALAHSVFTHLPSNHIRRCLTRLAEVMRVGGVFFATFFELPRGAVASEPYCHSPGDVTTYDDADPYHYWLSDMFYATSKLPGGFISSEAGTILALNECCPLPESANEATRSLGADKNGVIVLWG